MTREPDLERQIPMFAVIKLFPLPPLPPPMVQRVFESLVWVDPIFLTGTCSESPVNPTHPQSSRDNDCILPWRCPCSSPEIPLSRSPFVRRLGKKYLHPPPQVYYHNRHIEV